MPGQTSIRVKVVSPVTIAEVSRKCGLSADTLRYYERIGLLPSVNRNRSGSRDYTQADCNWVDFIKCMRSAGLPIDVLIEYVSLFQKGDATLEARKELLTVQRRLLMVRIAGMQATLDRLNYKIDSYEQAVVAREKALR